MNITGFKLKSWFAAALGGVYLNASACDFHNETAIMPVQVTINIPKSILVPRDAPIGSEVYRTSVSTSNIPDFECRGGQRAGYVSNDGAPDSAPSPLGSSGFAWKFFLNDKALLPYPQEVVPFGNVQYYRYRTGSFRLYKISESASEVTAVNVGEYQVDGTRLFRLVMSNTTAPAISSCSTPSINVPLGKQLSNKFKGVGSTIGEKAFSINLNNCSAGINSISYRLDPVNTALDAVNGILALDPGGATGVGIKIMDDNNAPVGLGESRGFLKNVAEGSYTIPLKAAYYKTSDSVVGGAANASMQFTITYQ